jgi:hypothetical protein
MAMTRKEQAAIQAAQAAMQDALDRVETFAALRWTNPVQRDVGIPKGGYSQGWDYNAWTKTVFTGWSCAVSHGTGPAPEAGAYRSGIQGSRRYYSTEALALAAMRHEIELKTAADLLKIDRQIAAALSASGAETTATGENDG